jgi:DNA helicase-2/ATP-dependent DNA helicase PcrA
VVQELSGLLGRNVAAVQDAITRLADDWDTLAADGAGWEQGFADPQFLDAWRQHREIYGYTLRSELVYQLLCELRSNPAFSPIPPATVVLVDEYQDLNLCELTTIRILAERSDAEVFAAGDDDQSIYSFRHAHPIGIRRFAEDYDGAAGPILKECLRCGDRIVQLANWLIAQEMGRIPKQLISVTEWPAEVHLIRFVNQDDEARSVARIVQAEIAHGTAPEEVLILLRADRNGQVSHPIAERLSQLGLRPYLARAGETEQPEIQMLLEYLILAQTLSEEERVDDLALRALLELEPNGIGATRLWAVTEYCRANHIRFNEGIDHFRGHPDDYQANGLTGLLSATDSVLQRAQSFEQGPDETFEDWLSRMCRALDITGDALGTVLAIGLQAQTEIERHENEGLAGMSFAQAMSASMTKLGDTLPSRYTGYVTVTTMHGAKGLSADIVIVLQAEDEVMPGNAGAPEYDELRRLLYVSLTRARRKLLIGACTRRSGPQRFVGNREVPVRHLTRFLADYGLVAESPNRYIGSL